MDAKHDSKPVIVLDEFQYLGKAEPAFPSIFQRIWEEILKKQSVMVILCGSLISMMEAQTLAYGSPLYGRRTAQIRLKQIPFAYYHEFSLAKPAENSLSYTLLQAVSPSISSYFRRVAISIVLSRNAY